MRFRSLLVVIHRWSGLITSPVLAIVGGTGALMIWKGSEPGLILKAAGKLHENLALGSTGVWIVLTASLVAVVLELTGLVLWWKTRSVRIRLRSGWRRALTDLHYTVGALGFAIMIVLAATAVFLPFVSPREYPQFRALLMQLHTGFKFPWAVKVLYSIASAAFVVQGLTGMIMWWMGRPAARSRRG